MNYPMAIVIAAALIAGAMFFSNQNDLGAAGSGTYAGVGVDNETNYVWAVNTQTGQMRRCKINYTYGTVVCTTSLP